MVEPAQKAVIDFYTYPPIGEDDWRYTFQTAQVRTLDTQMLSRATLLDMANSPNFQQAADLLGGTEYALPSGGRNFAEVEQVLMQSRTSVRGLFANLMVDERIVDLLRSRDDFTNIRTAVRRSVIEKPIGTDYSSDGNVEPEQLEQLFGEQAGTLTTPEYIREAIEQAVLAYYQDKDIRHIDYAIDNYQAQFNLDEAYWLKNLFLIGLFRIQIDLINIKTMFRLIFTESEERNVFVEGGFIELERFKQGLEHGYEGLGSLFFATPYQRLVDTGADYLASNKSFLKIEQQCEEYLIGFMRSTLRITAGPQPVIAYLLTKENEIRTIRLILTAKKSNLDTKLILDRIS